MKIWVSHTKKIMTLPQIFQLISFKKSSRCHYSERHNECDGVSNHHHLNCLLNRLFRRRTKKNNQSSASLAFVRGIHRWPGNSSYKAQKMFPFDEIIMCVMMIIKNTISTHASGIMPIFMTSQTTRLLWLLEFQLTIPSAIQLLCA